MTERILSLMKQLGMSQKNFAAEICISEGALSSIFNGRTKPTLNTVNNIHERFPEVNIGWLMDGKGEMFLDGTPSTAAGAATDCSSSSAQPAGGIPVQTSFMEQLSGGQMGVPQRAYIPADVKIVDKPQRHISEIRVFYDDGTFEVFPGKA